MDRLQFRFTTSSGAGGQNVNKVATRAEVRFHVASAEWLVPEVRGRLGEQQSSRMNQRGELIISSQEHRTQARNRARCIEKLAGMVEAALEPPKERKEYTDISKQGKARRKDDKRHRGKTKANRRVSKNDW